MDEVREMFEYFVFLSGIWVVARVVLWGACDPLPPPTSLSLSRFENPLFKQAAYGQWRKRHDHLMNTLSLGECDSPTPQRP